MLILGNVLILGVLIMSGESIILYYPSCNYFQGGLIGTNGALARRDAVEGARVDFDLAAQTPLADSAVF